MTRQNLATLDRDIGQMIGRPLQEAMAHGVENDMIYGGLLAGQSAVQGLCVAQAVQNCLVATRRVTWDGRVFRYSLSGNECDTFQANVFKNAIGTGAGDVGIDWSALAASAAIGATSIVMTNQGGHTIAANALVNGLLIMNSTGGTENNHIQQRRITANTAATLTGTCTISFAEPLVRALTAAVSYAYCMPSPYSDVRKCRLTHETGKISFCGYSAGEVATAALYHWEQTWGMISCALYGSAVGKTQYMRDVVFRYDGLLIHRGASGATGLEAQRAGFIVDHNDADNGATMIMLMIDH